MPAMLDADDSRFRRDLVEKNMMRGKQVPEEDGTVTWRSSCLLCGQPSEVKGLDAKGITRWQAGAFVQEAFPGLSADDREILVSGTHGDCYDLAFPEEEEEDWDDTELP